MPTTLMSDSTRYAEWFRCPFKRWLLTEYEGHGIVDKEGNVDTEFGTIMHTAVESMLHGEMTHTAAQKAFDSCLHQDWGLTLDGEKRSLEMAWLAYGLTHSFGMKRGALLDDYKIHAVEQELVIPLASGEVVWATRPDAILDRADGSHFNCNIKTTGYMKDVEKSFEFSVQMFMEAYAVKLTRGQDLQGTVIIALNKGSKGKPNKIDKEKGKTQGYRRESPFTYVWFKYGTWAHDWKAGSEKVPVWTFNNSPNEWLDKLADEVVYSQCEITPPITQSHMDLDSVIADIVSVEKSLASGFTPKSYNNCNNDGHFNRPCPYWTWCHGTDQERTENFMPRISNHPVEDTIRGRHISNSLEDSGGAW
jgi:hypothetical protein